MKMLAKKMKGGMCHGDFSVGKFDCLVLKNVGLEKFL